MNKLTLLFATSRPVSWVNTAFPFAAGYLMMGGSVDVRFIVATLFFLVPYNLVMYGINDVFDYESDIRNPRKGGVEGAITPKRFHPLIIRASLLVSLPFAVFLVTTNSLVSSVVLLAVMWFVIAYSAKGLRFKEVPLLDSATSSMHFVGPLLYAYSLVGVSYHGWIVALAFFAWGIASQAFGAVQDIVPDREAGIRSVATVLGARTTVWFATSMYMIAVVLVALLGGLGYVIALAGMMYVWNTLQYGMITDKTAARARNGWKRFLWMNYVMGFIVTLCLLSTKIG